MSEISIKRGILYEIEKISGSVFAASALAVGLLAGCGAGNKAEEGSTGGTKGGDTIKIRVNLELSGAVASYGFSELSGIELAVEEINEAGGIDGKKIVIVKVDNKSDNAEATSATIKLINDKVLQSLEQRQVVLPLLKLKLQIAIRRLLSVHLEQARSNCSRKWHVNQFVFRTSFIDPFQGTVAANFAANELKVKNVAIYSDNASDYSKGLASSFKKDFEAAGGKIVAEESY